MAKIKTSWEEFEKEIIKEFKQELERKDEGLMKVIIQVSKLNVGALQQIIAELEREEMWRDKVIFQQVIIAIVKGDVIVNV